MREILINHKDILYLFILIFIIYITVASIYFIIISFLRIRKIAKQKSRLNLRNRLNHEYYVPVSIIIPTHNQEKEVIKTMNSLLKLDYHLYEIIVVDDNSLDNTIKSLIKKFDLHLVDRPIRRVLETEAVLEVYQTSNQKIKITVVKKEQGGKKDALNVGLNIADFPYVLPLNPSSILLPNTLENLVCPILEDDKIVLTKGFTKLKDKKNILALSKTLSNNRSYHIKDDSTTASNFLLIKREVALEVGGYDLIGENFELERKIEKYLKSEKKKLDIKEAMNAILYLDTPFSIKAFYKDRKQNDKGLLRNFFKYRKENILKTLYSLFYEILSVLILLIGLVSMILMTLYHISDTTVVWAFLFVYLLLKSSLTFALYREMLRLEEEKISLGKIIKLYIASFLEVSILKFISEFAKIFAPFQIEED